MLALLSSKVTAYLVNLFSTNNHVLRDDLGRIPTPDMQAFPVVALAALANQLLDVRGSLEREFVVKYNTVLPEFEEGKVYVPPSRVLASMTLPKLTIMSLVGRGEVKNIGPTNGRVRALRARKAVIATVDAKRPYASAFAAILELFLSERERENQTWEEAQQWQLPDSVAATAWLNAYNTVCQQAQAQWDSFVALQKQVDETVADWYGFTAEMRTAIAEGLPWARRRRNNPSTSL